MYPYDIIPGISLYVIMICVGIISCFLVFSRLTDKRKISPKVHNLALICGVIGTAVGLGSATLFQALYNVKLLGKFEITDSTGATFYGGLIGGAAIFLAIYFVVGAIKINDGAHKKQFFSMMSCIAPAIAVAHGFGRLGCFSAGCCHGKLTEAWYGIMMHGSLGYAKYVPVQLFEALFLFALCAVMIVRASRSKKYNFSFYMTAYGIWRFFIEYARADYRGSTVVSFLTPSQLVAIVFVIGGIVLAFVERSVEHRSALSFEEQGNA